TTWVLIVLTFIDIDKMLLPDQLTLPLLWLMLVFSLTDSAFVTPAEAITGAAAGYLSLWSVYWLFKLLTGKEGMGYGDFKLMAVFGALLGWQQLPLIIILSSCVGAVVGITLLSVQGKDKATPIPFGPYIAAAGWIAMLWGEQLTNAYLRYLGL
ncbi:MAG TPA: A24 family peptidase, partial [Rheinheimera sp.]|nr:A24 family peptidase [Rheinheimera sp.]